MNEQREAITDRAIKSEQQRKRKDQFGSAQGVRRRHCQRHPVKVAGDTSRRIRKNQLFDAPLQQKNAEKEPQDEKRGGDASVLFRRTLGPPCGCASFERLARLITAT